jgi:hypothetical protein
MIANLTEEGLRWVLSHLRTADEVELRATAWQGSWEETLARMMAIPMIGWEARLDGTQEPAVVGGLVPIWSGLCSSWIFGTPKWPKVGREVTRFVVRTIMPGLKNAGVHRVECRPMCGNDEVIRWLHIIGFELEARVKAFGRGGEDFYLFARTWTDGRTAVH